MFLFKTYLVNQDDNKEEETIMNRSLKKHKLLNFSIMKFEQLFFLEFLGRISSRNVMSYGASKNHIKVPKQEKKSFGFEITKYNTIDIINVSNLLFSLNVILILEQIQ